MAEKTPQNPRGSGRKKLPRAVVWVQLQNLNYDPLIELVKTATDPDTPLKIKTDIDLELMSYVHAKQRSEVNLNVNQNPIADLLKAVAETGRPKPKQDDDE